jgi:putative peptidoglycan lipid II flippase
VQLLIRAFHALKDTVTPFVIITVSALVYLVISWVFVFKLESSVLGIAWATTVSAFIEAILFFILLEKRVKNLFFNKSFVQEQLKILVCSFLMAVFLYLPFKIFDELVFDTTKTVELIGLTVTTSTIGLLVYIYFSVLFDVQELAYFMNAFQKFGKWQQPLSESKEVLIESGVDGEDI